MAGCGDIRTAAAGPQPTETRMDDADVIKRIGALVDEEHELERSLGEQGPESDAASRLRSTNAGICSASGGPVARWATIPTRPRCARPRSWSATSSSASVAIRRADEAAAVASVADELVPWPEIRSLGSASG